MQARLRFLWKKARKLLERLGIIVVCMLVLTLLVLIILAYIFKVDVAGLRGKTLWDWLQLLIIPAVLAVGGYLFTFTTSRNERKAADLHNQTERDIAQDNQREAALQGYIDNMSELLLHEKLRESQPEDEVRQIARVRTLAVLPRLDGKRKRTAILFLHETGLISKDRVIINLEGADLMDIDLSGMSGDFREVSFRKADLSGANLIRADLSNADLSSANLHKAILAGAIMWCTKLEEANLEGANLYEADLTEANFSRANLRNTRLRKAKLRGAVLSKANLSKALITEEDLKEVKSLEGAIMPDGSTHP